MGIGPSTKETSLHHFRDPLLNVVSADNDLDLMGIILVGTPDINEDKLRVSTRAAIMAAAMRPDGVITSTDGWGNSDVDYCNMVEQVGRLGIPVTGLHFTGTCGRFVVSNDFLDNILDMNKGVGVETNRVGENAVNETDARKAVARLKLMMRKAKKKESSSK